MDYPLNLSFKILAFAPQLSITDATGALQFYVKQKAFKLKEEITIFADAGQTQPLYKINADRVIDFSAKYNFTDVEGKSYGAVKRQGMKSLWKSHYDVFFQGEQPEMTIQEENPWVKVMDHVLGEVPVLGMFTGYFFNPTYIVKSTDGTEIMRLKKQPAFLEGKFQLDLLAEELSEDQETNILLSIIMMTLLERMRG